MIQINDETAKFHRSMTFITELCGAAAVRSLNCLAETVQKNSESGGHNYLEKRAQRTEKFTRARKDIGT